ncbi:MAG: hypothetical protein C9356_09310 [Oleiphilus sp.]|nr:MAG: hypothetical protein C9356_09310 [Oleiphilus sp.]
MSNTTLIQQRCKKISLTTFGVRWESHTDSLGRAGLALKSDVGDRMVSIWYSRKQHWLFDTQPFASQQEAMSAAVNFYYLKLLQRIDQLAFYQLTTSKQRCLVKTLAIFPLISIERAILEKSIFDLLNENLGTQEQLAQETKEKRYRPRVMQVYFPHKHRQGRCQILPYPIRVKLERRSLRDNLPYTEFVGLSDITDKSIQDFCTRYFLSPS